MTREEFETLINTIPEKLANPDEINTIIETLSEGYITITTSLENVSKTLIQAQKENSDLSLANTKLAIQIGQPPQTPPTQKPPQAPPPSGTASFSDLFDANGNLK
jgi:regulator of replication initiation timing